MKILKSECSVCYAFNEKRYDYSVLLMYIICAYLSTQFFTLKFTTDIATYIYIIQQLSHFSGGLHKYFEEHKCILDYMTNFLDQKECIFSNYIVLILHMFKGLQYLHNRKIVHGDVKGLYNTI